jgi:hypothetical protein
LALALYRQGKDNIYPAYHDRENQVGQKGEKPVIDENDLSQEKKWFYEVKAKEVIKNLLKHNVNGQYVPSCKEALAAVMEMIPPGATVGRGNSISVNQVGVFEEIARRGQNKIIEFLYTTPENYAAYTPDESYRIEREVFFAEVFISGTNAITLDGKLVNTDGIGNRVAPMAFGPRKVIIIAGVNKIVRDLDEALFRIHNVAAPLNGMRHYLKHHFTEITELACVKTGKCVDCSHPARMCRCTVIIEGSDALQKGRINVVLVGEELGL